MRLKAEHAEAIHRLAVQVAGAGARVRLFGSRLNDSARGGDVDLLLEVPGPVDNPAWLASVFAGRVSRALGGRRVDVLIGAPNLMRLPIHERALQGRLL